MLRMIIRHFNFTRAWVGLERVTRGSSAWEWINDVPGDSLRWNQGEPNNFRGNEDCVVLLGGNARLNDNPCSVPELALCEKCLINN